MTTADAVAERPADTAIEERPTHLARCAFPLDGDGPCGVEVTFRLTASGAGLMVLAVAGAPIDQAFGIGPNAMPLCPHGHGEMQLADEALPAAAAVKAALELQDAADKPR